MTSRLEAKFAPAFSRDLKKKAKKRSWDLTELEKVIDLVIENSTKSLETLRTRHNMHRLSGRWMGSNECHVANAGDWLVVWRIDGDMPISSARVHTMSCFADSFERLISLALGASY